MLSARFAQRAVSKYRTSFRFHNQLMDWTFKDLDYFSDSFLAGLQENRVAADSTILTWLDDKHAAESITAMVGALKNGSQVVSLSKVLSKEKPSVDAIRQAVTSANPSLFLVSPNQIVDGVTKSELINRAFPEAQAFGKTGYLDLPKIPNLRFMVQTGLYNRPGFVRFRDFCVYVPPTMKKLDRVDISQALDRFQSKGQGWPTIELNEHVFFLSGLDNHDLVMRALYETASTGNLLDFVSREVITKSDFAFINDLDPEQGSYVVGDKADLDVARAKIRHQKVKYVEV
jgi:hypothetical protein